MNLDTKIFVDKIKTGFNSLKVDSKYKVSALSYIKDWLEKEEFEDYVPQIKYMIGCSDWDYLLDCFYQTIPFGTGGRRGEVGIGSNRINKWAIQASAQGHSQYLKKIYGNRLSERGIVLAYGVRQFFTNKHFNDRLPNPVKNLTGKDLAWAAASVYLANGVKVYIFNSPRTTPELSFSIRYLNACAGDMFDASHNPPEHNGKKVFDEFGGQLIPPDDEILVKEVTENVKKINTISTEKVNNHPLLKIISDEVDSAYIKAVDKMSMSNTRGVKIIYTPLHGVGMTSVYKLLKSKGFEIIDDPKTSYQSGKFENITYNIPNPEVEESFDTTLKYAKHVGGDLILNSDPDGDRIGVMVRQNNQWKYINGNEIGAILTRYVIEKKQSSLIKTGVIIKTTVTTNLATEICKSKGIKIICELPVGFKYIGAEMNKLEKQDSKDVFLFGLEESHGFIAGNYSHDKDAAVGALWLAELASELKKKNQTLIDYLDETYIKYGYFRNYLTEIRILGAEGMSQIRTIQDTVRKNPPSEFGKFKVKKIEDFWERKPIVSETDRVSKDVLIFHFYPPEGLENCKVTLRPSGTEPKIKMYFELSSKLSITKPLSLIKENVEALLKELEKLFMKHCYKILDIDFPDRGFLIFWQVPLKDKLKYFDIEEQIENIKKEPNGAKRQIDINNLLQFLEPDSISKVDKAFQEKYKISMRKYLNL